MYSVVAGTLIESVVTGCAMPEPLMVTGNQEVFLSEQNFGDRSSLGVVHV